MAIKIRLPDPIAYIFAPDPIVPEDTNLDPEDENLPDYGEVKVRALDCFLFVKDGKFVYPKHSHPQHWWKGVLAYGYMAALTGDFKHFIWSGKWGFDFDGKHCEAVILDNLVGLSKERSPHWREGMEPILWLETEQEFVYALLEPAEGYDRGNWKVVIDSWTHLPHPWSKRDPSFTPLNRKDPRPKWWRKDGDRAWRHWLTADETTNSPASAETTLALGIQGANPCAPSSKSTDVGTSSSRAAFTQSKLTALIGTRVGQNSSKAPSSCDASSGNAAEPIHVESSEEETPAPGLPLPRPAGHQVRRNRFQINRPGQEKTVKPVTKLLGGSNRSRGKKRRVVSGTSETHQRQKQKTVEYIDLTSDCSDSEKPLSQSQPPSTPKSPSHETDEVSKSSTCALDKEAPEASPKAKGAEGSPADPGTELPLSQPTMAPHLAWDLSNLYGNGLAHPSWIRWRDNYRHDSSMEPILWLETEQEFVYALLEPAEGYDRGNWKVVIDSWTDLPHPWSKRDPSFTPLNRKDPRPKWWHKDGDRAWRHWLTADETTNSPASAETTPALGLQGANPCAPSSESTDVGTSSSRAAFTQSKLTALIRTPVGQNSTKAPSSCDASSGNPAEPIHVESSEEETPAPSLPLPRPAGDQVRRNRFQINRPGQEKTVKPVTKMLGGSNRLRGKKRRVVSGTSETHQRQKQKTVEYIDLTSDCSDSEKPLSQSQPPSTPKAPSHETDEVSKSSTCALDKEAPEASPKAKGAEGSPADPGTELPLSQPKMAPHLAWDLSNLYGTDSAFIRPTNEVSADDRE
ncbi:hypothetical protein RSAG8_09740, partial [Rhizoctonia solani AG-8 WAC10335]